MNRYPLAFAVCSTLILWSNGAEAIVEIEEVLTPKAQSEEDFCVAAQDGRRFVDKRKLAEKILADLPSKAVPTGSGDASNLLASLLESTSEASKSPLTSTQLAITRFLNNRDVFLSPTSDQKIYQIHGTDDATFLDLFGSGASVTIECIPFKIEESEVSVFVTISSKISQIFRLRGKVGDLHKAATPGNIQDLSTATVSYTQNQAAGADTFSLDGVLGMELSTHTDVSIIPYVQYKRSETSKAGGTNEIEVISPGVLFSYTALDPNLTVTFDAAPKFILDTEQNAEEVAFDGTISPAFSFFGVPIGIYSHQGPIRIRPDIHFKYEGNYVLNAGSNPLLRNKDEFFAIGGVAEVAIQFPDIPFITNFTFNASYEWSEFISSPLDNLQRLELGASYFLGGAPNYVVSFKYVHGRNDLSLQKEEFWQVALGARF